MSTATAAPAVRDYRTEREKQIDESMTKALADHTVEVMLEQGVYRHYSCGKPGTCIMSFSIFTLPGRLIVSGDIGDLCVERTYDMFAWAWTSVRDVSYFEEKAWRCIKTKDFDEKAARAALKWEYDMHVDGATPAERRKHDEISREILRHIDDGEHALTQAYHESEWGRNGGDFPNFDNYTYEFLRCRYALRWFFKWCDKNRPNIPIVAAPWPAPDYMI